MGTITLLVDRLATSRDLIDADALYRDHAGEHLPVPDPDDLWEAIRLGQLFGCRTEAGGLLALGGTFPLARCRRVLGEAAEAPAELVGVREEAVQVHELAGMVVHPDARSMRPYGLQGVLTAVRVGALAQEQATGVCLLSSVAAANAKSLGNLKRCGLEELDRAVVPLWLDDVKRTWLPGRAPQVVDLIVRPPAVRVLSDVWRAAVSGACFRQADDGARTHHRFVFGKAADVGTTLERPGALAEWDVGVPAQRLVGREPPFIPWVRR